MPYHPLPDRVQFPTKEERALLNEILVKTRHIHNNVYGDMELEREIAAYNIRSIRSLKLICKENYLQVSGKKWELIARIMATTVYNVRVGNWDKERHRLVQKVYDLSVMVAFYTEQGHSYARNTGGSDGSYVGCGPWRKAWTGSAREYGIASLLREGYTNKYTRYYCGNRLDPTVMDRSFILKASALL